MPHTTSRALVGTACALYVLLHLVTIGRSHIPWFDDTFFASIADTLRRTGQFKLTVSPLWLEQPVYLYGPVYFLLVAGAFATFGLGVLQYRLTGLIGACVLVALAHRILRREGVERRFALAACALMALDPILLEFLRIGRMDLLAVSFFLLAYLLLVDSREATGRAAIAYSALSGIAASLGVLTTPRPGYLLIPMALILLYRCWPGPFAPRFAQGVAWVAGFLPLCIAWIAYAFGSIAALLAYFGEFADTYAGAGLTTVSIEKPVLALVLVMTLIKVAREPRQFLSELTLFIGMGIVLFFLFVRNKGPFGGGYTILVVPFEYMAIGWLLSSCPRVSVPISRTTLRRVVLALLFLLNGGAFLAIVSSDLLLWRALDPSEAQALVRDRIPPGSKVVGDDKFFFIVRRAGSDFQYMDRGGTLEERVKYHAGTYDFDYLVTDQDESSEALSAYRASTRLEKIGTIRTPPVSGFLRYPLFVRSKFMLWVFTTNYGGSLYKRVR
jgi:4-amino-4-deoxy-L-arabinose transferase-like glycosyltransferase